ncbi:chloride channel protein [Actinospongicola halichondriae]|uniref:chloride channel protein n=1 Tax=Actinospongicola halichondriae TaxID=3236844 RepID=UPI003D3852B6
MRDRIPFLWSRRRGAIAAVGLVGGLIGAAYVSALRLLELALSPDAHSQWVTVGVLGAVGLAIAVITRKLGDAGDVELLVDNIHVAGGANDVRALRSLIPVSLLGIAAGSALGPEAPLVQTAGTMGTATGARMGFDRDTVRVLTITGMAAAFAVLFGAPLGSAIFALEILHRRGLEYYEAMLPAIGGASIGFFVFAGLNRVGFEPILHLPDATTVGPADLGWSVVAGILGSALAVSFIISVRGFRTAARRIPTAIRPMVGGVAIGLLAVWSGAALTFGEGQIDVVVAGGLATSTLAAALVAKVLASSICLATGWKGGFIIPLFFIGATAAQLVHVAVPSAPVGVLVAACMVATNVAVTKTPIGTTLVVAEMGGVHLVPSMTIAALLAFVITSEVGLIQTQRTRETAEP